MPYQIHWFIEKRILLGRIYGDVIEADGIDLNKAMVKLIDEGTAPMLVVIHALDIIRVPHNLIPLVQSLNENKMNGNKVQWMIIVSNNRLHNFIGTVAAKVVGVHITVLPTLEATEAFIRTKVPDIAENMPALQVG